MLKEMITCPDCGYVAVDREKFKNHQPCSGEAETVWMSWGSGGRRVPNQEWGIKEGVKRILAEQPKAGSVSVHHGRCNLGKTTTAPCSCDPVTFLRPSGHVREQAAEGSARARALDPEKAGRA